MIIGKKSRLTAAGLLACVFVSPASAEKYTIDVDNYGVLGTPVNQPDPGFPNDGIRRGQEGWVRMNFILTEEGQAVEPIVIDSSGGAEFEKSALAAITNWQFEVPDTPRFNNTTDIRFERSRGTDRASFSFLRRYRRIVTSLHYGHPEVARKAVDQAIDFGGWNLYESTMLWLMVGRVAGAEGNSPGMLETYRRALEMSSRNMLDDEGRSDLLSKLFALEVELAQYASAKRTFGLLGDEPAGAAKLAKSRDKAAEIDRLMGGHEPLSARATIYNPCDCEAGEPLWSYVPGRRTFSFSNLNGNVERFEVRCERKRLSDSIETEKSWSLPADAGSCRVFVFGDDGASFDFVEHSDNEPTKVVGDMALAWHDVLDSRSRSQ